MGAEERECLDRESALIQEMNRLRSLLQKAGIEAEQSSQEITTFEKQYVRDLEEERAKTRTARATANELPIELRTH